jgi:hypothetical protein
MPKKVGEDASFPADAVGAAHNFCGNGDVPCWVNSRSFVRPRVSDGTDDRNFDRVSFCAIETHTHHRELSLRRHRIRNRRRAAAGSASIRDCSTISMPRRCWSGHRRHESVMILRRRDRHALLPNDKPFGFAQIMDATFSSPMTRARVRTSCF